MAVERLVSGSGVFILGKGLQLICTILNIYSGGSEERKIEDFPGNQTQGLKVVAVVYLCLHKLYYCFIFIISTDVYCHIFTTAHVTRDLKSPATGIALRIL